MHILLAIAGQYCMTVLLADNSDTLRLILSQNLLQVKKLTCSLLGQWI